MSRHLVSVFLLFLCVIVGAKQSLAAPAVEEAVVLVLPFQVNATSDLAKMKDELPLLIMERLKIKGLKVVNAKNVQALLKKNKIEFIDIDGARKLAKAAKADYAIYGALNQLGDAFVLDSRLVPTREQGMAKTIAVEKKNTIEIVNAVDELVNQASIIITADVETKGAHLAQPIGLGFVDVVVRGMRVLDPDVVLTRLSIRPGDTPDEIAVNNELRRVWDMGYFSDVQVGIEESPEGKILVFTVVEKPRIDKIIIEGSKDIDEEDVLSVMGTRTGSVLNEKILAEDLQKITDLYRKEGYYLAKAVHRIDGVQGGTAAVLVITVAEGSKLYIKQVNIEGLSQLEPDDFEDYMGLRPRSLLSWFTGTGVLKDEYLERDSNAIAAYALNEGFVDVQVSAPKIDYRSDGIYITFSVVEGERYKMGNIEFLGDLIVPAEQLNEVIELDGHKDTVGYFSLSVMQEDTKRLTNYYGEDGYAYAEVNTKVLKDKDGAAIVNIGYDIKKNNKVFIRRVSIEGNQKTRDNVILREMRLTDGDEYKGSKMIRSKERLNRLRYFSTVDTALVPTGVPDEVDLVVNVQEANTGALIGGIGYSSYYDIGVTASIMERNLFGKGYWIQLNGFFSWRRTSGVLSLTNPRFNDTNLLIANDLYYTYDYWDDFTKETIGDSIRIAYPLGEYVTLGAGYRLERYEMYDMDEFVAPSISDYKGVNWTSAIHGSITRDTVDRRDRPSKGTISRFWTEYGGGLIGGSDNFIKSVIDWQGYYTWTPDHTLRLRARVGGVFKNSSDVVPAFERFWIGGMDTIRGYTYSDLSPRDDQYYDEIGGDRMGVANFEYIWNFQKELGLALVPFVDVAFNIDSEQDQNINKYTVASTGLEVRWRSPMGDLRVAYAIPLSDNYDGERPQGRFEFTMGQSF